MVNEQTTFETQLKAERERLGITAKDFEVLVDGDYSASSFAKWVTGVEEPRASMQEWVLGKLAGFSPESARVTIKTAEQNAAMAALATKAHERK